MSLPRTGNGNNVKGKGFQEGFKETVAISLMSVEEKQVYERNRKALQREKRKSMTVTSPQQSANDEGNASTDVWEDHETDFSFDDIVRSDTIRRSRREKRKKKNGQ